MPLAPSGVRCRAHLVFDEGCWGCEVDRVQEQLTQLQSRFESDQEIALDELQSMEGMLARERKDRIEAEDARDAAEAEQERLEKELEQGGPVLEASKLIPGHVLRMWVADFPQDDWRRMLGKAELARRGED